MIKRTLSYTDYNGETRTEDHYFNMSKAEMAKMNMKMNGNYITYLQNLIQKRQIEELFDFIYNLILDSHGEKSLDGTKFLKSPEDRKDFESSPAFDEILTDIAGDSDKMAAFVKGIMPPGLVKESGDFNVTALPSTN